MSKFKFLLLISVLSLFIGCNQSNNGVDQILHNGIIYTLNESSPIVKAIAVENGKIVETGAFDELKKMADDQTELVDLNGLFVYPGFIEGHGHIFGIGNNILNVNLMGLESYKQVVEKVKERAKVTPKGEWIVGRGWHQDKWISQPESMFQGFPTHHQLSEAIPDHPVVLSHASGHASLINAKAMEILGIDKKNGNPEGGEIFKDISGNPTGILNETAQQLVASAFDQENPEEKKKALSLAIEECLKNGLTGFHQAGSIIADINLIEDFAKNDLLKLRMHLMIAGYDSVTIQQQFEAGPRTGLYGDHLNIQAIKLYADGALGSRGAWLLDEYEDSPGVHGHNVTPINEIKTLVKKAYSYDFQVCTHAIGDRANREVLNIYEEVLGDSIMSDHRYRIEHAQHIDPQDIPRFSQLGVYPAMQAIHMSSDRPWAIDRLGKERIENGAYMWRELIDQGSKIVNGTDAPVEPVNPLASFYASVSRKTLKGTPENGFEPSQKMTREEALKSYTIWPAYGAFMEDKVGSIEPGKYADFTVLNKDIMTISESEILETKVVKTIIGGKSVFENPNFVKTK